MKKEVLNWLAQPNPPWFAFVARTTEDEKWEDRHLYNPDKINRDVRVIRGNKMRTTQSLMTEFGAVYQLFDDFGENWHALKECMSYLDEWLPASSYVLVVHNAQDVLHDETAEEMKWFLLTLQEVAQWWATPVTDNEPYNRPKIPFHTVFTCPQQEWAKTIRRYESAIGSTISVY